MWSLRKNAPRVLQRPARVIGEILIFIASLTLLAASLTAAAGLMPWYQLTLSVAGSVVLVSGQWLQIGVTVGLVALTLYQQAKAGALLDDATAEPDLPVWQRPLAGQSGPAAPSMLQDPQEIDAALAELTQRKPSFSRQFRNLA
jgi:hypothetical protein